MLSISRQGRKSLYDPNAEMSARDLAVQWHTQQKERVALYKPKKPEISGDHGCAGECTVPVPTPPGSEGFSTRSEWSTRWLVFMAIVAVSYVGLTRRAK